MAGKNTSERIAAIALRLIERHGPGAVSMRRIARASGITSMAIYHHFPSRAALLNAVTDREFEKLAGFMDQRSARGKTRSRIRASLWRLPRAA